MQQSVESRSKNTQQGCRMFQCIKIRFYLQSVNTCATKIVFAIVLVFCCLLFTKSFWLSVNRFHQEPTIFAKKDSKKTSVNLSTFSHNSTLVVEGGYDNSTLVVDEGYVEYKFSKRRKCKSGTRRRLPRCIIIGFRKCGTLALLSLLKLHPAIAVRDWRPVEVDYFNFHYDKGLKWYTAAMPCSTSNQITIEKSPKYIITQGVAKKIRKDLPGVKMLVLVREPIERTVSLFLERGRLKHQTFLEFITSNADPNPVDEGKYVTYIARWLRVFPREHLHIVSGDELVRNPISELRKIEKFLNLDHLIPEDAFVYREDKGFNCFHERRNKTFSKDVICLAKNKGRKHPDVPEELQKRLKQIFQPYNEQLYRIANRSFHW